MKKNGFKDETELCLRVADWLTHWEGWEVYFEVFTNGGDCDIVAVRDGFVWIIECKLQFGADVCEQAAERLRLAHYVSVATPRPTRTREMFDDYLKRHGIGKLYVDAPRPAYTKAGAMPGQFSIHEEIGPKLFRVGRGKSQTRLQHVEKIRAFREKLTAHHKTLIPGAPGGGQATPFKLTMLRVQDFLARRGPSTIEEIVGLAGHHYRTSAGAKSGISEAMRKYPEFRNLFETVKIDGRVKWKLKEKTA